MVPRLPSASRARDSAARRGLQHEIPTAGEPTRIGPPIDGRVPHRQRDHSHELQRVPSMSIRKDLATDLAELEQALHGRSGRQYWRSLDELAGTAAFQKLMRREFPQQADVWPDSLSRRHFLTLMGASLALAGLSGCSV